MLIHNAILSVAEASATFELLLFWLLRLMCKSCFALMLSLCDFFPSISLGHEFWDQLATALQAVLGLILVLMVLVWFWRRRLSRKWLSGKRCSRQILGAILNLR